MEVVPARIGRVQLLERLARHDDALEGLLPVEGDGIVLAPLPQAAADPDAADAPFEHGAIDRVEDVSAVEDQRARPGAEGPKPQIVGEVLLVALGMERRAPDERHHVEALRLDPTHAARVRGERRAGPPGVEGAGDQRAALGMAEPDAIRRHEDDFRGGGVHLRRPSGRRPGRCLGSELVQDRPGRRLDRGSASPHMVGDPAQVGKDLGIEEPVEPEDAGWRRNEGVVLTGKPMVGAAVEEGHPGDEQVRHERLQTITAARIAEDDADIGTRGDVERQDLAIVERRKCPGRARRSSRVCPRCW